MRAKLMWRIGSRIPGTERYRVRQRLLKLRRELDDNPIMQVLTGKKTIEEIQRQP